MKLYQLNDKLVYIFLTKLKSLDSDVEQRKISHTIAFVTEFPVIISAVQIGVFHLNEIKYWATIRTIM